MAKDKHELESMTKDDLVAYADNVGAEVQHSWLKEEIVAAILKSQRAAAKQKQPASKEVGMNDTVEDEAEVAPVKVTGPINIKGQDYVAGDEVYLTEEEVASMTAAGCPIEGVEPLDDEAVQAKHDEGVEAQKARLEADAEAAEQADEEAEARAKPKS